MWLAIVVEIFPFSQFLIEINVIGVAEKLVDPGTGDLDGVVTLQIPRDAPWTQVVGLSPEKKPNPRDSGC